MFALVLMNISCTKPTDDNTSTTQTLASLNPNWVNLTWYSTDGASVSSTYPKLTITIGGNPEVVTVTKYTTDASHYLVGKYTEMTVSGSEVTFTDHYQDYDGTGETLTCTNVNVGAVQKLRCFLVLEYSLYCHHYFSGQ